MYHKERDNNQTSIYTIDLKTKGTDRKKCWSLRAEKVEENSLRKTYFVTIDVESGEWGQQEEKSQYKMRWCGDMLLAGGTGYIHGYEYVEDI